MPAKSSERRKKMGYSSFNPNPMGRSVGDCAVRAVAKATGQSWEAAYAALALEGFLRGDLPNADSVWGPYLQRHGFTRRMIPEELDGCTVAEFAEAFPKGTYILSMPGRHVLCVQDGNWFDSWDSGGEVPVYYWTKER